MSLWTDITSDLNPENLYNSLASLPGTPEAAIAGLDAGAKGQASWNPYSPNNSVWDIGAGGTQLSQSASNRAAGRTIGTAIGSFFGAEALGAGGVGADAASTGASGAGGYSAAADSQAANLAGDYTAADYAAGSAYPGITADTGSLASGLGGGTASDFVGYVQPADINYLPVTGAGEGGIATLDATTAANLGVDSSNLYGIDPATADSVTSGGFGTDALTSNDPTLAGGLSGGGEAGPSGGGFGDFASSAWNKIKGVNPLQAAALGLAVRNATHQPSLPSSAQTAVGLAGPAAAQAQATIASGGTNTPIWASQKASIDSQIQQQLSAAIEQMKQSAASSGMGGNNSAVVQQKIAQLTAQATTQAQQLYMQAQQQNVSNAVAELNGGNQVLTQAAQMQLTQSQQAQQAAFQTGQLALLLGKNNSSSTTPGV